MLTHKEEYTEEELKELKRRLHDIYKGTEKSLFSVMDKYLKNKKNVEKELLKQLKDGDINQSQYNRKIKKQVFSGKEWKRTRLKMANEVYKSNEEATDYTNERLDNVYVESYNSSTFETEKHYGRDLGIGLLTYSVLKEKQKEKEIAIPYKKVNKAKDMMFNERRIQNAVNRGIEKNKRLDKINEIASNMVAKKTEEQSYRALEYMTMSISELADYDNALDMKEELGIEITKIWIATLDHKTRDEHRMLDGEEVKMEEPFEINGYEIMYPRDPYAEPEMVCNCRCAWERNYPDYEKINPLTRRENIERKVEGGGTLKQDIPDMTYQEWERWEKEKYG